MTIIEEKQFGGERPLFGIKDTKLQNVTITDGESGVKCCSNIEVDNCKFYGKYPLWHVEDSLVTNCYFAPESRSAIWYCSNMVMQNCLIDGPKFFREMNGVEIENVTIADADETFWKVDNLKVKNVKLCGGTYPFMFCHNIEVDGLQSDSKYCFQYVRNCVARNIEITTKDAFWETENVTVYDSTLNGEYLGWHSKGLKLVRCHITGEQPLCYVNGLVLEDCTFDAECDRMFEDSVVEADIKGCVTNIKNPKSGKVTADNIGSVTIDEFVKQPANCVICDRSKS